MDFTNLSFDDLMDPGAKGHEIRLAVAEAVAQGVVDPAICLRLAELCVGQGKPVVALELVTAELGGRLQDMAAVQGPLAGSLGLAIRTLLRPDDEAAGRLAVSGFFAALDRLDTDTHRAVMAQVAAELVRDPDLCRVFVTGYEHDPAVAPSQSAVAAMLAAAQFAYDLEAARRIAARLAELPGRTFWTSQALAKFALLEGDYLAAEMLCRDGVGRFGVRLSLLCDLAVSLFCQGRERAGREAFEVTKDIVKGFDEVRERQQQITEWSRQLDEKIAAGDVDGGGLKQIGSAVHYTHPERVREFYDAHRGDCVAANGCRTVSGYTNNVMFDEVEKLLAAHPSIRKVINYGTLCGVREDELAARYPDVIWAGYDVSELATQWNREAYRRDNLVFDSDLERLLRELTKSEGEALLVHCRTTDIMLPEAVKRVYHLCREHGVTRVMTAEYFSRSMPTLDYPDFEKTPVDTVHWDGILVIHNYRKILPETGYAVTHAEFRPVPLLVSATGEGLLNEQMIELVHGEVESA